MPRRLPGAEPPRPYVFRFEALADALRLSTQTHFNHADLAALAGLDPRERIPAVVNRLVETGVLVRLHRGLFVHGAFEKPQPSPRQIIHWRFGEDCYLTFDSAMRAHDRQGPLSEGTLYLHAAKPSKPFAVSPSLEAVAVVVGRRWQHTVVRAQVEGLGEMWVSDTLCTALDGLQQPRFCGDILRVARFVAAHQASWSDAQVVEVAGHAPQYGIQRLGYLVRLCGRDLPASLRLDRVERDRRALVLDASAPRVTGKADRLWRINVNVDPAALRAAISAATASGVPTSTSN